jgi:NAD(P)-dependent dehydrogenase (short-subunit alcohol dehydrogenase family)
MSRFENRSALVTGAGSGIGRAVCRSLAAGGGFVWAADINEAAAEATVRLVAENGGRAVAVRLDVRDEGSWTNALGLSDAHAEPLRILVNCAGKSAIADTFTMPLEDLRAIMSINVEGTFLGMKHAIPRIAASGGGAVINISSFAGLRGIARMTAYSGSKGAIRMMTKAVALECADLGNGVRVNSVHPGVVDTPAWNQHTPEEAAAAFLGHVGTDAPAAVGAHEVAKELVPIGVAASAEEIAETVCFLASDAARHITGAEIAIDGGMTAR